MYCPSCGAESALELNYCNRCGANMASSIVPAREIVPVSLTKPAVAIGLTTLLLTLGGFGLLIVGAINLALVLKDPDIIIPLIMFGMITILVSDIMLIRLLSRIIRASLDAKPIAQLPRPAVKETPRQLSPRLEPVPSVTEHTTRTFTPAFKEPPDRGTR